MYSVKKHFNSICLVILLIVLFTNTHAQTISDNVIKKNIFPISNPLQSILKLEPRVFEYDTDTFKHLQLKQGKQFGFLAENMNEVFPGMVSRKNISYMYGKNSYRDSKINSIDEVSLIPVLVASVQELYNEIEQLKLEIQRLKK